MKSLLRKAEELRKAAGSELAERSGFVFDKSSGISKEDQADILLHIDRVAQSSRILAGPDTWKVRPKKRGISLPVIVNIVGLAALAGGLFALDRVFSRTSEASEAGTAVLASAEGRLLQEIKREAEGRIQEKDREIATIQARMASLDKEKEQLLESVEARIRAKALELEDRLKQELERERERLIAEGLSESAIQERLQEFERRKTEEFKTQLASFSRQAEEERMALQDTMDKARAEYMKSLSEATVDRQRIQDESRAREQALRSQLDDKNAALEAERARAAVSLRDAQAELARLNEDAARVKAAEARLLGLYAAARQSLRDGRLDDASSSLASLRSSLSDPQLAGMPALAQRRELDLFAADLIEKAIGAERAKASVETSRLSAALDALAVVQGETERARAAAASGDREAAAASYRRALGATKELEEAGAFVEADWRARLEAQAASAESAVRAAAGKLAADTKAALESIESARDERAQESAFGRLLGNLPLGPSDAARVYAFVRGAGTRDSDAARRAEDTAAAAAPFRAAASDLAAERFLEAIQGYSSVLARFPAAGQAPSAAEGMGQAIAGLAAALRASRERVADLEARLEESRERSTELETKLAAAETDAAGSRARAADLERSLAAGPAGSAGAAEAGAPTSAEYAALRDEKARVESELAAARARYGAVSAAYAAYAADEDAILGRGGELALIEAKARLDEFLSGPAVGEALPGLRARIARYLSSFQSAGQKEVLFNAADIVEGASRIADAAARSRYFSDLAARYAGDGPMLEFLAAVEGSLR